MIVLHTINMGLVACCYVSLSKGIAAKLQTVLLPNDLVLSIRIIYVIACQRFSSNYDVR